MIREPGDLSGGDSPHLRGFGREASQAARSVPAVGITPLEDPEMRRLLFSAWTVLALALALALAACGGAGGGGAASGGGCLNPSAAHKAYLVVEHADGKVIDRCVGFAGSQINGEDLMKQSGVEYQAQAFSFGKAVCQIDNEPKQFSECFPKDQPYWALYEQTQGQPWVQAQSGYAQVNLSDGDALGWRYTAATASPAPPPPPKK